MFTHYNKPYYVSLRLTFICDTRPVNKVLANEVTASSIAEGPIERAMDPLAETEAALTLVNLNLTRTLTLTVTHRNSITLTLTLTLTLTPII